MVVDIFGGPGPQIYLPPPLEPCSSNLGAARAAAVVVDICSSRNPGELRLRLGYCQSRFSHLERQLEDFTKNPGRLCYNGPGALVKPPACAGGTGGPFY